MKKGGSNLYAPTLYAPSMYAQPAYSGHLLNQPSMPMLPLPNGAGPPPSQNGYGRDYDGASSGENSLKTRLMLHKSRLKIAEDEYFL